MTEKCGRCGKKFSSGDWSCTKCGRTRMSCAECGAGMKRDDNVCGECGAVRELACGECGDLIKATNSTCPNCGFDANEAATQAGKKRAAIGGIIIVVAYGLMTAISGALPDFLSAIGTVVALPVFLVGGYVGYQGVKKIQTEDKSAADRETTKQLLKEDDYGTLDNVSDLLEGDSKGSGEPAEVRRRRKRKRQARIQRKNHDLPSECPYCNTSWLEGGFEVYDDGNQVRCKECGMSKMLFS